MNGFIRLFSFHTEGQLLFFLYRRRKLKPWSLCWHRHETAANRPANVTGTRTTMIKTVFYEDRSGWPFSVGEFYPSLHPRPFILTPQDINIRPSQCALVKNDQIMFIVRIISPIINNDARLLRHLSLLSVFSGGSWELKRVKLNTREEEGGKKKEKWNQYCINAVKLA